MSYSQRDEELHILPYFEGQKGTFLDIGAYHPFTFSNTRALYERGWTGTYVEPAGDLMNNFRDVYKDTDIQLIQKAVGSENTEATFYNSGGDAVGTLSSGHADLWRNNYGVPYKEETVQVITVDKLLELCKYKTFDFISIDIEGLDLQVFNQFDFNQTGTRMVCVEWNGHNKNAFIGHANQFGMIVIYESAENLIFVK